MAVFDMDWETQFCDSSHREITRKITQSFCDGMKHGWIGRCLPRLFQQHRMVDVAVAYHTVTVDYEFSKLLLGGHVTQAVANGTLSSDEANLWWTDLARANRDGVFLYGFTAFIVTGTKQH